MAYVFYLFFVWLFWSKHRTLYIWGDNVSKQNIVGDTNTPVKDWPNPQGSRLMQCKASTSETDRAAPHRFSSCGLCRHLVAVYRRYSKQIDPTAVEVRLLKVKGCIKDAGWTYWTLRVNTPFKCSVNRYFARSNPPKLSSTAEGAQYTCCMTLIYSLSIRRSFKSSCIPCNGNQKE